MRSRIRNILIESLILESPLFRAVGLKDGDRVYEGQPYDTHADMIMEYFGEDIYSDYPDGFEDSDDVWDFLDRRGVVEGFITIDGQFVSRDEAGEMVKFPETYTMRQNGEMIDDLYVEQ